MQIELKLNNLPESVTEASISQWYKQVGERVQRDEKLLDVETDKVMLEIPSPVDGVLEAIRAAEGSTVAADDVLAILSDSPDQQQEQSKDFGKDETIAERQETPRFGPAVKHLINQYRLDAGQITPSGSKGQILKQDVLDYIRQHKIADSSSATQADVVVAEQADEHQAAPSAQQDTRATAAVQNQVSTATTAATARETRRQPMSSIRRMIAQRLLQAQQNAAILTTFNEVDMSQVIHLRKTYGERFKDKYQVKLGFMSFFVRAVTQALQQFPVINSSVEGDDILYHEYYDIGIAVGSKRGLVVPVLRNADSMSFARIEQQIATYAAQARAGTIALEDITGGTFSISNGGVYGSLLSTPILNPPQSAILGLHKIEKRAVVIDDEIVIRPMMYLALSYDHRIIDGSDAVQFLVHVKNNIEDMANILLEL